MDIVCARCGGSFRPRQRNSRFCSKDCRQRAYAARKAGKPEAVGSVVVVDFSVAGTSADSIGAVEAARADLDAAGRLNSYLGQAALALALRIDTSVAVNGYAALVKEFRETMAEALKDADRNESALDEINESAAAALELIRGA